MRVRECLWFYCPRIIATDYMKRRFGVCNIPPFISSCGRRDWGLNRGEWGACMRGKSGQGCLAQRDLINGGLQISRRRSHALAFASPNMQMHRWGGVSTLAKMNEHVVSDVLLLAMKCYCGAR